MADNAYFIEAITATEPHISYSMSSFAQFSTAVIDKRKEDKCLKLKYAHPWNRVASCDSRVTDAEKRRAIAKASRTS